MDKKRKRNIRKRRNGGYVNEKRSKGEADETLRRGRREVDER